MKKYFSWQNPALWFVAVGLAAVIGGGMLSAFLAKQPSTLAMWASAYLVLVVGVAQTGFGACMMFLGRPAFLATQWLALILYNFGNIGVLIGTAYKIESFGRFLVDAGGIALAAALVCMMLSVRGNKRSWLVIGFYALTAILLVSACIGLWLSRAVAPPR